jgi:hypothetical protein
LSQVRVRGVGFRRRGRSGRSLDLGDEVGDGMKKPPRSALPVSSRNHRSTRFSHENEVEVKCMWKRECLAYRTANLEAHVLRSRTNFRTSCRFATKGRKIGLHVRGGKAFHIAATVKTKIRSLQNLVRAGAPVKLCGRLYVET